MITFACCVWTLLCVWAGFWLRGEANYRRLMESIGTPVESKVNVQETVPSEMVKLDEG